MQEAVPLQVKTHRNSINRSTDQEKLAMASLQPEAVVQAEPIVSANVIQPGGILKTSSSIARQASIYSLTLDEFQNVLGESTKTFGSMNMDEFLKNIWTVEESQAMVAAMGGAGSTEDVELSFQEGVQRQSSISLPRTLSRKTVDAVWNDITRGSIDMGSDPMSIAAVGEHERQVTFGEMTLEDFLVKAGVVKKDDPAIASDMPLGVAFNKGCGAASSNRAGKKFAHAKAPFVMKGMEMGKVGATGLPMLSLAGSNVPVNQSGLEPMQIESMNHTSPVMQRLEWFPNNAFKTELACGQSPHSIIHQHVMEVGNGGLMGGLGALGPDLGVGLAGGADPVSLALRTGSPQSPLLDGISSPYDSMGMHSPLSYGVEGGVVRGRKRDFEGSLEKVVERRQKRMIKNRESAARSRARKQAYTVELEAEVSHLKEENLRLRCLEEEMAERRRKQLIDVLSSFGSHFTLKSCKLRRTHTGPW